METKKFNRISFAEVDSLAAILPARQKGHFTFEVATTYTEGTLPVLVKGLKADATTLKAAAKEAGRYMADLHKAHNPVYMMLFFYMDGLFIGTMAIGEVNPSIRCDFSGLAISNTINETEEPITAAPANESEANELTEAAHLLDIYVYNECEIYDKHIAPAIDKVAAMIRSNARSAKGGNWQITAAAISEEPHVKKAVSIAAGIVRKYDGVTPTQDDKKAVRLSLAAYVIECAQYELKTA